MKKLFTFLILISVAINLFATDFSYDGINYTILDETAKTCSTIESPDVYGNIIIPQTVKYNNTSYTVTAIGDNSFKNCAALTSITLPDGVTEIGNNAFYYCSSLTSINIPDVVKSIGKSAFSGCGGLTSITLPDGVTTIGSAAFSCCISLTSINIPDGVTEIGNSAFSYCRSLTSITLPDGVTTIGWWAFSYCSLTSITLPDGVTEIGNWAFHDCGSLTSINIPEGVTEIGSWAFSGCSSLTSINIPDGVTRIDVGTFSGCSSLTSITLPDGVTEIDASAFSGCSLTSITLPDGVTEIGGGAFYSCSNLTSLTLPAGVTAIGESAFNGCSNLTSINIPDGVTKISTGTFRDCSSLTSITLPDVVTEIGGYTFSGCSSLASINIPDGVTKIDEGTFYGCSSLTSINIPDGVTAIGECAFYDCGSLTSINIPEGVTEIGGGAFAGCYSLTSITLPDGVTEIGTSAFYGCSSLTSITLPDGVTEIAMSAFYGCSSLTSITLPDGVTEIGTSAFYGCSSLTSINIPDGVTTIGSLAFYYCNSLTSINIPDGVTEIGNNAFSYCRSLTSINIPEGVTEIGSNAFDYVENIKELFYSAKAPRFNCDNLGAIYANRAKTTLYVPVGSRKNYENSSGWKDFMAIEEFHVPVKSLSFSSKNISIKMNEEFQLDVTIKPSSATDKTVTWSSSNPSVATVSDTGLVKGISGGSATITAKCGDVVDTCEVEVLPVEVNNIVLSQTELSLFCNDEYQFFATVLPANAYDKTLTWSSSNEEVATVSESGLVKAQSVGMATITAEHGNVKATCGITVIPRQVSIAQESAELEIGQSTRLTANVLPANLDNKDIIWKSSNPSVAEVSESGEVTAIAAGVAVITATCGEASAFCIVTVAEKEIGNPLSISIRLEVNDTLQLAAIGGKDDTIGVEWASSNPDIVEVSADGKVRAIGSGSAVVTAICGEVSASCVFEIPLVTGNSNLRADANGDVTVFNLHGIQLKATTREDLKHLTPGIYIVNDRVELIK